MKKEKQKDKCTISGGLSAYLDSRCGGGVLEDGCAQEAETIFPPQWQRFPGLSWPTGLTSSDLEFQCVQAEPVPRASPKQVSHECRGLRRGPGVSPLFRTWDRPGLGQDSPPTFFSARMGQWHGVSRGGTSRVGVKDRGREIRHTKD